MQRPFSVRPALAKLGMDADNRNQLTWVHDRSKMFKAQQSRVPIRSHSIEHPASTMRPRITRMARICSCRGSRVGCDLSLNSELSPFNSRPPMRTRGFTLLELLVVMGIIALLMALVAPAFTNIKSAGDVTSAAYTIKGVLDTARTYSKANNTYTWVGFFEEDASQESTNPATAGPGRVVISIVASKDGTKIY